GLCLPGLGVLSSVWGSVVGRRAVPTSCRGSVRGWVGGQPRLDWPLAFWRDWRWMARLGRLLGVRPRVRWMRVRMFVLLSVGGWVWVCPRRSVSGGVWGGVCGVFPLSTPFVARLAGGRGNRAGGCVEV